MSNSRKVMQVAVVALATTTAIVLVRTVFDPSYSQPTVHARIELERSATANTELRDKDLHLNEQDEQDHTDSIYGLDEDEKTTFSDEENTTDIPVSDTPVIPVKPDTSDIRTKPSIPVTQPHPAALHPVSDLEPVTQFVFTKIEKTGSSTFFAVLARFVQKHKLNILMQKKRVHINWESPKGVGWDIGPAKVNQADVLINHALYIKPNIDKYVRPGYQYIAMVREPVSWFKSAIKYYRGQVKGRSAEQVIKDDKYMYLVRNNQNGGPTGLHSWFHLAQLQWMGFDYSQKGNVSAMAEYIEWLSKQIDVVMLTDQYDPSLVVLRRRFHWTYTDIFYKRYIITNSASEKLSPQATEKLLSAKVNLGDKMLYDKLNETFWRQPELRQADFWDEAKYFGDLNLQVSLKLCPEVIRTRKTYIIPASNWVGEEQLTYQLCQTLLHNTYGQMMTGLGHYALGAGYRP